MPVFYRVSHYSIPSEDYAGKTEHSLKYVGADWGQSGWTDFEMDKERKRTSKFHFILGCRGENQPLQTVMNWTFSTDQLYRVVGICRFSWPSLRIP